MWSVSRPGWWAGVLPTAVLPLAVAMVTVVGTVAASSGQPAARPLDAIGIVLLVTGAAALVVRRWNPPAVLGIAAAAAAGYLAAGYPYGPVFLAGIVALCSAVVSGNRRGAYTVTAVAFVVLLVMHVVRNPDQAPPLFGAGGWLSSLALVIAGCELWRARRERLAQTRAAHEEAERRQVIEERLRMARELHDALGHHVSLINVQAGVALYLMDDDPDQARRALSAIKQSSRELLGEMRSTLGVLRGVDEEPSRNPVAGLARLDDLVDDNRAAGLPVTVEIRGAARELPPSVDLAAYRIVQEALTNTRRHAGASQATVIVDYDADGLTLEVEDDGTGPPTQRRSGAFGGNGLPGMRERATALGGSLTAGAGDLGGFRVHAHLPIAHSAAAARADTP